MTYAHPPSPARAPPTPSTPDQLTITAAVVTSRVLSALQPGEIVLMHIGSNPDDQSTFDADALPGLISQLRARSYSFVTLDALAD